MTVTRKKTTTKASKAKKLEALDKKNQEQAVNAAQVKYNYPDGENKKEFRRKARATVNRYKKAIDKAETKTEKAKLEKEFQAWADKTYSIADAIPQVS